MSGAAHSTIAPRTITGAQSALIELNGVSKRFVKPLDVAARIGNVFGAAIAEEVVHAVDNVDLRITEGEVVGLVLGRQPRLHARERLRSTWARALRTRT